MKKILMYGIGSYKNRGVEAIVKSTIDQLDKDFKVTIANLYNEENSKKYKNQVAKYIPQISLKNKISDTYTKDKEKLRKIQKDTILEIDKNDICISCGGDNYCYNASDWLYVMDEASKNKNKKLVLWGASLYDEINDINLINDMNIFDLLYIRESISYDAIKNYVDEKKLFLCPDPAFSLSVKEIKLDDWYKNRKIIGINLSPFTINDENKEAYPAILKLVDYILKNTDYSIDLIPHVTQKESNDITILKKIYNQYKGDRIHLVEDKYDCCEIKYVISKYDLLIASRTHASIAGYSQCIPTLVIGYSVKARGIAKDIFGTYDNYVISYKSLTEKNMLYLFKWFLKNKNLIKERLEKVIPDMRVRAGNAMKEIINKLEENELKTICNKKDCIGCLLCKNKCPKDAITIEKNDMGYCYPKIDLEKCIKCNLCRDVCPVNKPKTSPKSEKICYACKSKNENVRLNSSSGGFFQVLATQFIKDMNGVVYGASVINGQTKHIKVSKVADLKKIRGSKYTQSMIIDIMPNLDEDIKNERNILFSGTPCQIDAVKKLANNYKNIYYASIICHGVMNNDVEKFVLKRKGYPKNFKVEYHRKDIAWDAPTIKIETKTNEEVIAYGDSDLMTLYLNNTVLRHSCYSCKFKGNNNYSDIIMGDYWGVFKHHSEIYDKTGVSAVIINTKKGQKLFEKLNLLSHLDYEETDYNNIVEGNPLIEDSVTRTLDRYKFLENANRNSIELITERIKLNNEISALNTRYEELIEIKDFIYNQKVDLQFQLDEIKNSKRWKIIDKVSNSINRVRGK